MKILALEKQLTSVNWENESLILIEEARSIYKLILSGIIREIYFNDHFHAVLILECQNKQDARILLSSLPLVAKKIIEFDIIELHPYTGLSRLMKSVE